MAHWQFYSLILMCCMLFFRESDTAAAACNLNPSDGLDPACCEKVFPGVNQDVNRYTVIRGCTGYYHEVVNNPNVAAGNHFCAAGSLFNTKTCQCDYPRNVKCRHRPESKYKYAICLVTPDRNYKGNRGQVTGKILFKQRYYPSTNQADHIEIDVNLSGFTKGGHPEHGTHVHVYGDRTNGCKSFGGHYNPFDMHHGAPSDIDRHVGDLGNIYVWHGKTTASHRFTDRLVSLVGKHNVLGRGIMIHEFRDNFKSHGHTAANARMACCTIAVSGDSHWKALP